jgi:hypothetical protein
MIPSFKQYLVEENREVFFTFGRMNPPTIGHGKLLSVLSTKAGKNPWFAYVSQSQNAKKDPLTYDQKVKHVRKMFPKFGRNVMLDKKVRTVFDIAVILFDQGFNRITMVVGSDRVTEFKTLLDKYNGEKARHGFYNFEKIMVVSAGERDPDAEGVEGMSASKQRENAKNNDFAVGWDSKKQLHLEITLNLNQYQRHERNSFKVSYSILLTKLLLASQVRRVTFRLLVLTMLS